METFRDIGEESMFFRRQQITKYTHVYSITLQVQNNAVAGNAVNVAPILEIMEDADFHITHMTGSVTDPVSVDGVRRVNTSSSAFGLLFPMAGAANRGGNGIWFKFENPKANLSLQKAMPPANAVIEAAQFLSPYDQSLISFNDVFMPGYGHAWGKPIKFDYTLLRGERLKIVLQNRQRDSATSYSRVSIAFVGHRYAK